MSDQELAFSETVSNIRRGRTNYVVVDVLNDTKRDILLPKGEIIGSVHSVSAVMPLVNVAGQVNSRSTAQVNSVGGGKNTTTTSDNLVPVSEPDDGVDPDGMSPDGMTPEAGANEQDQDLSGSENESENSLDTDHHTDQVETSEHEESDSDSSEDEVPVRPKRTACPKKVLSYDKGGKPIYKSVTHGKVEKVKGQLRQ